MNHQHHIKKIRKIVKKYSPEGALKAQKLFHFKYPKIFLLIFSIILAYFIFKNPNIVNWMNQLEKFSYFGIFIAGMFIAIGFLAAFAVGFFIVIHPQNLLLTTFIATLGALASDMLIFKFIKISFMDEFDKLKKTKAVNNIKTIFDKSLGIRIRHYILYLFAGILIATPLPDEMGVSLLAGLTTIKPKILAIISFILHFVAIYIILRASI